MKVTRVSNHLDSCADELTYNSSEDILLKNTRLVIPTTLQEGATQLAHVGHQGIEKTKSLLQEKIWYPNMDKRVKEIVDKCIACQSVGNGNNCEPMEITPTEDKPWANTQNWTVLISGDRHLL